MTTAVITGTGWAVTGLAGVTDLLRPGSEAGPVFDLERDVTGRGLRHKDRASRLALGAAERALRAAGLLGADLGAAAVVVSSNFGNLDTVCDFVDTIAAETVTEISPIRVPHMSSNVTACWVALEHGLSGPNLTLCSGIPSGLDALAWARTLIVAGRADVALVIGVEPDTAPVARLHRETGADRWLDGAVALVVEAGDHARARGATAHAEIRGYGRTLDPESAERAALLESSAEPNAESRTGIGLWLGAGPAAGYPRTLDLSARLGRCSGALGVLQCAVGAEYLAGQPAGDPGVLAVAGGPDTEGEGGAAAAMVLEKPCEGKDSGHDPDC
ncbi:beta-ketoacyl synthase N-terminal-like domain-containing protein [Nocardia sp. NPDC088792]|uniref:beta-ketoacyl synthase N-terminal-like domain-containing protein n=1 Tax=Nocardia sp. NPDC088792 TaxID=3364332 RepID=UPI0037FFCD65